MKTSATFLLLLSLLFCSESYAQSAYPNDRFSFGVMGGVPLVGTYQNGVSLSRAVGGFAGLDLGYSLSLKERGLSLHFQPNWERFSCNVPNSYFSNGIHFQSLNLPVLLRYRLSNQSKIKPFVEFGTGYVARLKTINKRDEIICPFAPPCRSLGVRDEELIPGSKGSNLIVLAGVGAELQLGAVKVPISIRLNEGIGTFSLKRSYNDREPFAGLKTRTIQLVAGVSF